jgi:hypothetical protein
MVAQLVKDFPKSTIFWDVMLCSTVESHHRFGGTYCLHFLVEESAKHEICKEQLLISRLAYCPTLMLEAVIASETSVNFYWTALPYIPEITAVKN